MTAREARPLGPPGGACSRRPVRTGRYRHGNGKQALYSRAPDAHATGPRGPFVVECSACGAPAASARRVRPAPPPLLVVGTVAAVLQLHVLPGLRGADLAGRRLVTPDPPGSRKEKANDRRLAVVPSCSPCAAWAPPVAATMTTTARRARRRTRRPSLAGEIVIGTTDSLQNSFDPAQAYDYFGGEVIHNTAETLVTYKPNATEPSPLLAAEMPEVSADGLTYTFVLRDGVKFPDGTDLRRRGGQVLPGAGPGLRRQGCRGGRVPARPASRASRPRPTTRSSSR